jgi:hypothetical protein
VGSFGLNTLLHVQRMIALTCLFRQASVPQPVETRVPGILRPENILNLQFLFLERITP